MFKAIRFTFTKTVTLDTLWYDEEWHQQLLEHGLSDEEALREMLRVGWEEDWTSLVQEMNEGLLGSLGASEFVAGVSDVAVVPASAGGSS